MRCPGPESGRAAGARAFRPLLAAAVSLLAATLCLSCPGNSGRPVVIWTNQKEFASYAELFNASHQNTKVVVIYKEKPVESVPAAKDEQQPDIVIGPLLKNQSVKRNFRPVDYLFSEQQINPAAFYPQLLDAGRIDDRQYLLPVSFNLPAVIFSRKNSQSVSESYIITPDQIRDTASQYNKRNESGIYTQMGFAPSWDSRFLYTAAKIRHGEFSEQGNMFSWNQRNLDKTAIYLREWTKRANTSTSAEQDFAFKYLYTPGYKQVESGRCLFSFATSGEIFTLPAEQLQDIDFRWIHEDFQIPLEDDMVYLGLYKKARNPDGAEKFITWLTKEDTQRSLLERSSGMSLRVSTFGISGGFSSIRSVNERIFPMYYQSLLGNIPAADCLVPPAALPPRWESLKARVVMPWLEGATDTEAEAEPKTMEAFIADWSKQFN